MARFILRWYWIVSGFLKKHLKGLLIGLVVGVLAFIEGSKLVHLLPFKNSHYYGRIGTYTIQTLPLDIQQKVSSGLTRINPDGSTDLDTAQTMTISQDGKSYTFTLNPNSFWSTGTKLNSGDITLAPSDVQISHPSDETISFNLSEPFAPFPIIASQPILKKISGRWPLKKTTIVGLNEYQITNIKTTDQYLRSLTLNGKKDIIHYIFYPTEADSVTALKLGHIDNIEMVTNPYLTDWPNMTAKEIQPVKRYLALFYNTQNADLQDKTIRQLLSYAAPKDPLKQRVLSPISKLSWAYNPQVKPYDYNLETAKSMFDKLKTANSNMVLNFELTTTPTYSDIADSIVTSWQQIGINAKVKIVPYPDLNDYQILLIGQEIPDDPDQYALWHSTQTSNITKYQNPKIDKLLEDGRKETDTEKRKQIYQDFQRFLLEDSPATFLYDLPLYNVSRKSSS